jgi:hypothetical protein
MLLGSVTIIIVLLLTARGWLPRGYFAKRTATRPVVAARPKAEEKVLVGAGNSN